MSSFNVTISTDEVLAAAAQLERIDGAAINALLTRVVNETAGRFDTKLRRGMNAGIALDDGYISSRMEVESAANIPRVTITAAGPGRAGRQGLTILGHYNPTRTKSGVAITVNRGRPVELTRRTFVMKLKRGTVAGDKLGVFERTGQDRPGKRGWKHLYGVSPYSLFRFQITEQQDEMDRELQQAALAALAKL